MSYDTGVGQRTAVVTGCASAHGIGLATARRYAQEGWALAMIDRDEAVVGNAEALAAEYGVPTIGRAVDVCDRAAVFAFAADVAAADLPAVGAIANIAGVASPAAFLDPVSYTHLDVYKRQTPSWPSASRPGWASSPPPGGPGAPTPRAASRSTSR